jgi:hypothetical protein
MQTKHNPHLLNLTVFQTLCLRIREKSEVKYRRREVVRGDWLARGVGNGILCGCVDYDRLQCLVDEVFCARSSCLHDLHELDTCIEPFEIRAVHCLNLAALPSAGNLVADAIAKHSS